MGVRSVIIFLLLAVVATACTSEGSRPAEFDAMPTDEIGCTIKYGDAVPYVVGPLGTGDTHDFEPNDWTLIHVGRTALEVFVTAKNPRSESHGSVALNDLPSDGVIARDNMIDGGNPGYIVTCWRGNL